MVSWAWIPIVLVIGVLIGFFLVALVETSKDD